VSRGGDRAAGRLRGVDRSQVYYAYHALQMGGGQSRRRLGAGSLEAKLIRGFGPYLYYRFREGGRHRSMYVGKVAPADT
jgi:hypothetical protein